MRARRVRAPGASTTPAPRRPPPPAPGVRRIDGVPGPIGSRTLDLNAFSFPLDAAGSGRTLPMLNVFNIPPRSLEAPMSALFITYLVYLAVSIALTVWVGRTLYRNGHVFLVDVFRGNAALAQSVNHLLVVGFYLVNLGFVCLWLRLGIPVHQSHEAVEALASKIGLVLLVLGGMHFANVIVFSRIRARAALCDLAPPVAPDAVLAAPQKA